jgi:hypothetical protein
VAIGAGQSHSYDVSIQTSNVSLGTHYATVTFTLLDANGTGQTETVPVTLVVTPQDGSTLPSVAIADVTKAEGNSGTTAFDFTVSLSFSTTRTVTVNYASANGSATAGSDYTALSGSLTFAPGQTSKTVRVLVTGDRLCEDDEDFFVRLTNGANAIVTQGVATVTIVNDDVEMIGVSDVNKDEGNAGTKNFVFTVSLSNPITKTVTVDYGTRDGSAIAGSDYTATSGTLTFAPGQMSRTVTVAVAGDTDFEPDETFFLDLTNPTIAGLAVDHGLGTIVNDDGIRISGTVTSTATGLPIAGATLLVVANTQSLAVVTGLNGTYRLSVPTDLRDQTQYVSLQAGAASYVDRAVSVNLLVGNQTKNIALQPLGNSVLVVEPALHHLGDGVFSTPLNAGLQTLVAEGASFSTSFKVTSEQLPPTFTTARLEITVNGAECSDPVYVNGTQISLHNNTAIGPQTVTLSFSISLLHAGLNTLSLSAAPDNYGGLDDFEFSNLHVRLA